MTLLFKVLKFIGWEAFAGSHIGQVLLWIWKFISGLYFLNWVWNLVSGFIGYTYSMFWWLLPDLWQQFLKDVLKVDKATFGSIGKNVHRVLADFMGFPVTEQTVTSVVDGSISEAELLEFAGVFSKSITDVFQLKKVALGYFDRKPGIAEQENFKRFIALNARTRIGTIMCDLLKDQYPKNVAQGIPGIAEGVNKLMGLEDAQEEILEPLMEKMIVEGWTKYFNREILPVDLTPSDAIAAWIRGYVGDDDLKLILDNEGIRYGNRETLKKLRANTLSLSDYANLYERDVWTRTELKANIKLNGYLEDDAEYKTRLIEQDRLWKLKNELLQCKESQFVNSVIDESSFRTFLQAAGYDQQEEDIEVEIGKCKQSLGKTKTAKQITGTFNVTTPKASAGGASVMSWNIRNATRVTITDLGEVEPRGEIIVYPTETRTYYLDASSDTDSERFSAVVVVPGTVEQKRPTASLSLTPRSGAIGSPRELRWSSSRADTVFLEGVGLVEPSGFQLVFPFLPQIYTLTATNAAGTTTAQDVALVELPTIPGLESQQPRVTLTILPGIVGPLQPQSELKWLVSNSDRQTLIAPDGTRESIDSSGTRIITSAASGIWTLEAENSAGKTTRQEAVIFKTAELQ